MRTGSFLLYTHWDITKRQKINSHSQASLSSWKPLKCHLSLFSCVEKTIRPIRSNCHSCPIGSISLFKPFAKLYKFALWTSWKWVRKDLLCMELRYRNMLKARRTQTKEKTKQDEQLFKEFLRMEKNKERQVHSIASAELSKYLAEFLYPVRQQDGEDYEPPSLQCLLSSIERWLPLEYLQWQTIWIDKSKQRELKTNSAVAPKKGKENQNQQSDSDLTLQVLFHILCSLLNSAFLT